MPQMKPILWLYNFILFIMTLLMYNIMNYYIFISLPKFNYFKIKINKKNIWKW